MGSGFRVIDKMAGYPRRKWEGEKEGSFFPRDTSISWELSLKIRARGLAGDRSRSADEVSATSISDSILAKTRRQPGGRKFDSAFSIRLHVHTE